MKTNDNARHTQAELLPWYVNGTLDAAERRDVERHLESCAQCRGELPLLAGMRDVLAAPVNSSASGFDDLLARINHTERRAHGQRLALAAAVMMAFAILLGVALQQQFLAPHYRTATDATPAASEVVMLDLRFAPQARLASLRGILQDYNAVIVGGPDERGRVRLQFALPADGSADTLLTRLRSDARVADARPADVATDVRK